VEEVDHTLHLNSKEKIEINPFDGDEGLIQDEPSSTNDTLSLPNDNLTFNLKKLQKIGNRITEPKETPQIESNSTDEESESSAEN
jgi:hypothetical protein